MVVRQSFSYYDPYPMGAVAALAVWKDSQGKKFTVVENRTYEGKLVSTVMRYKNVRASVQVDRYRVAYSLISQ